ncbi:MAG: hypothetical protein LBV74_12995, partial [Tannerella sp.]|nr:hypothetical protein [Tannerella sp.]
MTESFQYYTYDFKEVVPSLDDLLRFMKSETIGEPNPVKEIAGEFLGLLQSYDAIEGGYVVKPVTLTEQKELRIEDMILNTGRQVAGYLKGTETAAVFVCTAGRIFSDLSKTNNGDGNYLEAYIVDAIGSLTVENAMDRIQADLK